MATQTLHTVQGWVGRHVPRVDAVAKVRGTAVYTVDIVLPGMATGRLLRSPHAHALIKKIDISRALRIPGVLAVLTSDDLRDFEARNTATFVDSHLLARGRVRYQGEPVAAVAAVDEVAAEAALAVIDVEYEPLPVVASIQEALAPDAPALHEGGNLKATFLQEYGDVEQGFQEADYVFEDEFYFPTTHHYSLEPHVAVAQWQGGELTVWSSTRSVHDVRAVCAAGFDLELSRVRVIVPAVGGAYGSKSYIRLEPLAAALAKAAGRPVQLKLSVDEGFQTITGGTVLVRLKTGVRRDGTLTAKAVEAYPEIGAYGDIGPVGFKMGASVAYRAVGPYRIPHVRLSGGVVYVNKAPTGALRGYGMQQAVWATESQMDMIARRLGIDPVEFRRRNLVPRGGAYAGGSATPIDSDTAQVLEQVEAKVKVTGNTEATRETARGTGFAIGMKDSGSNRRVVVAIVRLHADGSVTVQAGAADTGQGVRTVLSQVAAHALAVPLERVQVAGSETAVAPFDQSTGSSATTVVSGKAVQLAAENVRDQLLDIAASLWGRPREELWIADGHVCCHDRRASYAELIAEYFGLPGGEVVGVGTYRRLPRPDGKRENPFWETGVGGAQVEVDRETGAVRVIRYVAASDVGKAINPQQAEGQDEGGAVMGMGQALFEEMVYEEGQLLNGNLVDYRVPTFADIPDVGSFESLLIENGDGPGPYGAKGVGESGLLPVSAAIANAVEDAVGVRITRLPLTPERVWRALSATSR